MPPRLSWFIAAASLGVVVPRFVEMGFTHIMPDGPDHILFILGLFFLGRSFEALIIQITTFTIAHSLTLGLSLYGFVSVSDRVVEVAIALSIAFIAVENLFNERLTRWRPLVVFGCGLIHGLGFAHAFQETAVEPGDFLPAIFSFNVGIELGQLAVVGLAFTAVALAWNREWYRRAIAQPASAMIALAGIYWAVERSL